MDDEIKLRLQRWERARYWATWFMLMSEGLIMGSLSVWAMWQAGDTRQYVLLGMSASAALALTFSEIMHRKQMAELREFFERQLEQDRQLTNLFNEHVRLHLAMKPSEPTPPIERKH